MTESGFAQGLPDNPGHGAYGPFGRPQSSQYGAGAGQEGAYPGQGAAGNPPPAQERARAKGIVGSLFDFGFTSFLTPKVIKVLYVLIMVVLGLAGLGSAFAAGQLSTVAGIFVLVIVAPVLFFVFLALYRIFLELFVVIFRIGEDLRTIRERGELR